MSATTIYAAVAALDVTIDGSTPTVYGVTAGKKSVLAGQLPARLISLSLGSDEAQAQASTLGVNPAMQVTYTIKDLLVWRNLAHGNPLAADESALLGYCDQWVEAYQTNIDLTANATITGMQIAPGQFAFGQRGEYLGCEVILTVVELKA